MLQPLHPALPAVANEHRVPNASAAQGGRTPVRRLGRTDAEDRGPTNGRDLPGLCVCHRDVQSAK